MKTWIMAAALLLATGAFADDKSKTSQTGVDATQVGKEIKQGAQEWGQQAGLATESQGTFKRAAAYDMQGVAKDPEGDEITLIREGLPPANLDVRKNTIVMLDGRKVEARAIPEGAFVRAKFQIEGDETVAVELNASSQGKQGTGGAGN